MNTQGIGLGLVISENIVNQFSGNIGVKSKYGKGTTFAFSFNIETKSVQSGSSNFINSSSGGYVGISGYIKSSEASQIPLKMQPFVLPNPVIEQD